MPEHAHTVPSLAALIVDTLVRLGVTHFVVSPGSRSAPLTIALAQRNDVTRHLLYDERSAAYLALGHAQQVGAPSALICTSGTAAANYLPAIAEAFYQHIPLIAVTADRPPEWIDQQDNQAIRQSSLFRDHVLASFTLPVDDDSDVARWHAVRAVADACAVATGSAPGPVHLNVPLREPLYAPLPHAPLSAPRHVARAAQVVEVLDEGEWPTIVDAWQGARRKLIVAGLHAPSPHLASTLESLARNPSVTVIGDVTANLHATPAAIPHWEAALADASPQEREELQPDLVLSLGGPLTSRPLRALIRARQPEHFWRVGPERPAPDTFQALTLALPLRAEHFLGSLAERAAGSPLATANYAQSWRALGERSSRRLDETLDAAPWSEFAALREVLRCLPAASRLQLGNSMPIRYANLLAGDLPRHLVRVDSNRGASGIDGTVSTAVGAALAHPSLTTLVVGDLGFFYDRNGLWHDHMPPNLRIVLSNNHGGGIFDIIDGPEVLAADLRRRFFLTPHALSARHTCEDHGVGYQHVAALSQLRDALTSLFEPSERPRLLEVETELAVNTAVFRAWKSSRSVAE